MAAPGPEMGAGGRLFWVDLTRLTSRAPTAGIAAELPSPGASWNVFGGGFQSLAIARADGKVAPKADLPRQNLRDTKKSLC